jgi:hypothetical protein
MKEGAIVKVPGSRRHYVVRRITKAEIVRGVNARRPGLYLMGALWYGRNPNVTDSFGKILLPHGRVIGNIRGVNHLTGARRRKFL